MNALSHETTDRRPASAPTRNRLLVVDDHPVFRLGVRQLLQDLDDITVVGEADHAKAALEAARAHSPDLVLLDVSLPGTNGIELIKQMLSETPALKILVISAYDESVYALRALRAGARGYVMKLESMQNIIDAVRRVLAGSIYVSPEFSEKLVFKAVRGSECDVALPVDTLSDRELEILQLFGRKKSAREVASMLHLSVKTIETHRAHIKKKLGFKEADAMAEFAEEWIETVEA